MDDIIKVLKNTTQAKSAKYWLFLMNNMIAGMLSNKKITTIVTDLFVRGRKLNISLVFITQSYFAVPKNIRPNSTCVEFILLSK